MTPFDLTKLSYHLLLCWYVWRVWRVSPCYRGQVATSTNTAPRYKDTKPNAWPRCYDNAVDRNVIYNTCILIPHQATQVRYIGMTFYNRPQNT